jgi:probable rRNA maturation factor
VILSAQKIRAQAKEYGHSQKMEAGFLLVHGLLHTLGWDHERTAKEAKGMRALEEKIVQRCGIDCAR